MAQRASWVLLLGGVLTTGCASGLPEARDVARAILAPGKAEQRRDAAQAAISALRGGRFEEAGKRAEDQLAADAANPYARLVRAAARYKKTMLQLSLDLRTTLMGGVAAGGINHKYLRTALTDGEAGLAAVEADLAVAGTAPDLAVELCVACWEIDWNGNGRIDEGDRRLFQIERDEGGADIPEGDPRRKPTFRFDVGDVAWARAFVSFERAAIDVVLAYDWTALDELVADHGPAPEALVLRLAHGDRIASARKRILEGLDHSDAARRAYLAETDDDREWVPSPRQHSHPMPLPVDQALYDTWEGVLGDVRRLVRGEEGLAAADLLALAAPEADRPPRGFVDVGGMLAHPRDITLRISDLERHARDGELAGLFRAVLDDHYVAAMKASPLPRRLLRMKGEVDRRQEGWERKLRYLFWLN